MAKKKKNQKSRALTGAWIETILTMNVDVENKVAPSRARGLKRRPMTQRYSTPVVAPSRARGLKPHHWVRSTISHSVAPSRARGLKRSGLQR